MNLWVSLALKATIVLSVALAAVRLGRHRQASVRHALLAAAFGSLLLLPVAIATLPQMTIPISSYQPSVSVVGGTSALFAMIPPLSPNRADTSVMSVPAAVASWSVAQAIAALWAVGVIALSVPVIVSAWRLRRIRRYGIPWMRGQILVNMAAAGAGVRRRIDVLTTEEVDGPATFGLMRPAILMPRNAPQWSNVVLMTAFAHEIEHIRRGDWIIQVMTRFICALYWCLPSAWIAWRCLRLEAEHACDDVALTYTSRESYAAQLVNLARQMPARVSSPALSMANRSDLSHRVASVLDSTRRRGRITRYGALAACALACGFVMAIAPLDVAAEAQNQVQAARNDASVPTAFEVASVRPIPATDGGTAVPVLLPGRLEYRGATLKNMIAAAYETQASRIVEGPGYAKELNQYRFNVEAKTGLPAGSPETVLVAVRPMLKRFLAERFNAILRVEQRESRMFVLKQGKNGPTFKPAPEEDSRVLSTKLTPGPGRIVFSNSQLTGLANTMGGMLQAPVLDETGLKGYYNFTWQWILDDGVEVTPAQAMENLGLKLEERRGPVEFVVVDRAQMPTTN